MGDALESRVPADWLWLGRHVKIGDGTTLLTPDTPANQHAWPQARTQNRGVGFPILRMVVLLSLATAAVCGVAVGPYKGKQTGEPALLRELLDRFQAGDVFLGDCCFASYFLLALLLACGVDSVVRQHQRRRTDFRLGEKLGRKDHVVDWQRPACPEWMDPETYAQIPETISVRELEVRVEVRGFRVQQLVVATTLTDARRYPHAEIARLFRARWNVELDLRSYQDHPAYGRPSLQNSRDGAARDPRALAFLQPDPQGDGASRTECGAIATAVEFCRRGRGDRRRLGQCECCPLRHVGLPGANTVAADCLARGGRSTEPCRAARDQTAP